jgi:uncharacterized membrane protein AbrB (regulator of aidB expression)
VIGWLGAWVGWGWGLALVAWVAGTVFILAVVDKMFRSRLTTAAVMVVWTMVLLGMAAKMFGLRPPG